MSRFSIRRWLNALRGPAPRRRQRPGIRPRLEVLEDRTCPSTLTVTSAADDGSSGTLRSVIAGASAGSTIVFDSSLKDQTITLKSGPLSLTQNVDIEGLGASHLTVSGNAAGRVFDVAVDLRRHSPSFRRSVGTELSADGNRLFLIPKGCAHGFLTLADDSGILYYMGEAFVPGTGQGVRWNDPAFKIAWPATPRLISERDAAYPDFDVAGRDR